MTNPPSQAGGQTGKQPARTRFEQPFAPRKSAETKRDIARKQHTAHFTNRADNRSE